MTRLIPLISRRQAIAALGAAAFPASVLAQIQQAMRVVVASSAGSTLDVIARTVQPVLSGALGSPVVVENVAGAGGIIAMQALARAPADGSVLSVQSNNLVTAPLVMKTAPYDPVNDFTAIAMVGMIPLALVTNPSRIPATNAKEFVAFVKANAGKVNYGSSGKGSTLHFAVEQIQDELGIKLNHIPYKGVAPMVNDLIGGQIDFAVSALPPVHSHVRGGALRAIALLNNHRTTMAPEIATFAEQGFPNFNFDVWVAVLGPKNMPAAKVKSSHDAVLAAFNNPAIREALEKQGNLVKASSPAEAQAIVKHDSAKYRALAKKINLAVQGS